MYNQVLLRSRDRNAVLSFQSAVSLHGHTRHSQESLRFIATILEKSSLSRRWIAHQTQECRRITGVTLDLERAHWTPPLCERLAFELESQQIEAMGLRPMVSLTDHNSIDACTLLRTDPARQNTPISTEWTVPFADIVVHIGVHNLPPAQAQSLMAAMHETTAGADDSRTIALFAELCAIPDVLLVFNHPCWNLIELKADHFHYELGRFLESANRYLHAFELNGMRDHRENRAVIELAAEWNQVVISGGDRHGCEPNAWLNLTNAADFPEFVDEVRNGRQSTVLIMPQYAQPLAWRFYQNFAHVVADYPDHPVGRQRWDERTFHPDCEGALAPMSRLWKNGRVPEFLETIFKAAVMGSRLPIHGMLRGWRNKENETLLVPPMPARSGLRNGSAQRSPEPSLEDLYTREAAAD